MLQTCLTTKDTLDRAECLLQDDNVHMGREVAEVLELFHLSRREGVENHRRWSRAAGGGMRQRRDRDRDWGGRQGEVSKFSGRFKKGGLTVWMKV
jgi:hypothetical protein